MKRLHVLSVLNTLYFGGGENRVLSLARTIDRNRFRHTVLTLKEIDPQRESTLGSLRPHFEASGIDVVNLGERAPAAAQAHGTLRKVAQSVPRLLTTLQKLVAFIHAERIDIVDAHIGTGKQVGTAAAVLSRRPVVVTTYGLEHFHPRWLSNASELAVLGAASAIVTDSQAVASDIRAKTGAGKRIAVIANGIPQLESPFSNAQMRARLNLPRDPSTKIIGQVASLTPRKGHLTLLDAARTIVDKYPSVHFLFCGFARPPFEYEDTVRARVKELELEKYVTLTGYPGDIADVYQAIDIQVHAASAESLPQAIIEGMSMRKPAVVTAIAGIPSIVSDGFTGLVVAPQHSNALADALLRLLHEPQLARRLGDGAYERFVSHYTDTHMTRQLEELFLDVTGNFRTRAIAG
jgi:glycosyltransferase involved in cell wall biosynthesis